jgi:hypothetical protein
MVVIWLPNIETDDAHSSFPNVLFNSVVLEFYEIFMIPNYPGITGKRSKFARIRRDAYIKKDVWKAQCLSLVESVSRS